MATRTKSTTRKKLSTNRPTPAASDTGTMSTSQTIVWWCLHALVFLVPIAMSNWTWLGFRLPITFDQFDILKVFLQRGITLIALAAWSWHILGRGGKVRRTGIDYLILVLLGWILLTSILSIHPPTAFFGKYRRFEGFISFVNYATIFFLTVQMVDRASRIRALARTLFAGGLIVSIYGIMQYIGIDPITWGNLPFEANRAFSTYGNPDMLGGYIIFPLVISLALALSESDTRWRIVYWTGFLLAVATWIVAFTRGAWIGGVFALGILVFVAFRHRVKLGAVDYSFMGAVGAVATGLVIVSLNATSAVMNVVARIVSIVDFDGGSAKTRFQIWQAAIDGIKDRPIFGFGADTFRLIFPRYKPIEYTNTAGYLSVADNVHNYPLQISAALGIPGFLLLYGTFGAAAWLSAPAVFRKQDGPDRLVLAGFWAAAAGYLAHLMFGISVTGSSFLLWVCMAVVLSPVARTIDVKAPRWGAGAGIVIILLVTVLSIGNFMYISADWHYLWARVYSQGPERVERINKAISLNPTNDMYRTELGVAHVDNTVSLITQARTAADQGQDATALQQQARSSFTQAEIALRDVIEWVPWEYDNYVFLANLYNLGADVFDPSYRDKAVDIARKGVEVEPYGPAIRFQLARALMLRGDLEEAAEEIDFAVEMDPNYTEAVLLQAEVYRNMGDFERALESYKEVLRTKPDYPGVQGLADSIEASLTGQ